MENANHNKAHKALNDAILTMEAALESLKTAVELLYETKQQQESSGAQQAERFLETTEAAAILGLKPVTLKIWRTQNKGPRYCKLGRRVLYPYSELMRWVEAQLRSTFGSPRGGAA